MSVTQEQREQTINTAIREISHIATLPEITLKIIDLVEDPRSTAQDLHNVISNDPALCSRILKVVNSSFYGLPGQIGSINRAIVMLGLNAVKNIAIAASLAKLFRGGELTPNFSARDLWVHSNATAAISKALADTLKLGFSDEAFLGGLIHDIGVMVEMQFDRNKLIEVIEQVGADSKGVPANDMIALEEEHYHADHQGFGAALCEKWKFPKSFGLVTGYHHRPLEVARENRTLVCVVHAADKLAAQFEDTGFRLDITDPTIGQDVMETLGLSAEKLEQFRERLPDLLEDVKSNLL